MAVLGMFPYGIRRRVLERIWSWEGRHGKVLLFRYLDNQVTAVSSIVSSLCKSKSSLCNHVYFNCVTREACSKKKPETPTAIQSHCRCGLSNVCVIPCSYPAGVILFENAPKPYPKEENKKRCVSPRAAMGAEMILSQIPTRCWFIVLPPSRCRRPGRRGPDVLRLAAMDQVTEELGSITWSRSPIIEERLMACSKTGLSQVVVLLEIPRIGVAPIHHLLSVSNLPTLRDLAILKPLVQCIP